MFIVIAILVVLIIIAAVAYEKGWLNSYIPTSWAKQGFVGAMGRSPDMQHCIAYSGDATRDPYFNRCNYV